VERFAAFPSRLAEAARVAGPTLAGEWGPAEVVRHLIAVEDEVHRKRLADLDGAEEPRWSWTEPGLALGFDDAPLDAVLAAFADARTGTVDVVRALNEAGWARSGIHATFGRLDVAGLLRLATDHDEEHLAGIAPTG
jgi:hypothetical protein